MKDSKGREYDGWALKHEDWGLQTWTFATTRTGLYSVLLGEAWEGPPSRRTRIRQYTNMGYRAVKVRLAEVEG